MKKEPSETNAVFRRKGDLGIPFIIGLFVLAAVLGWVVFRNYIQSEKSVTAALSQIKIDAPNLTIEQCAQKNIEWYLHCDAMQQICDDTVSRMMKVCLVLGDKASQCSVYGNEVLGYNFGAEQCKPYFKNRNQKKACADTWQAIADFCKAVAKSTSK
ncbi:MAG: hypothetical protein V4591_02510 [Bdellovibrionota bacterium]